MGTTTGRGRTAAGRSAAERLRTLTPRDRTQAVVTAYESGLVVPGGRGR
ncbi:hypothetical protein [Kitasatospora phosalacinea]|uniref:Uncharacterized protein n=1 Tax=Kitasatospora phosalacinea TaxID=2065 RepID=A0ABW6GFM8_9ACTN